MMTVSPMTIRSNGFNSTRSGIVVSFSRVRGHDYPRPFRSVTCRNTQQARHHKIQGTLRPKAAGVPPPPRVLVSPPDLAGQLRHALVGLVGQGPRGHRGRLGGGRGATGLCAASSGGAAVGVSWARMLWCWVTGLPGTAGAEESGPGAAGVVHVSGLVMVPPIEPPAATDPRVEEA